jgi:uncharacterized protein YndB with AHSA1/START domain
VPDVRWRIHLASSPEAVYELLSTGEGRARFWAESAAAEDGAVAFEFPDGTRWVGRVVEADPPRRFSVEYLGNSTASFTIEADDAGGTDLTIEETGVPPDWIGENRAGWVSVLLTLKAAADFGVDLRNHDASRSWSQGYCDN